MKLDSWIAALTLLCLSACGGGGADEPQPIPARAGAASIGAAGGSVDAVLAGGATVLLEVPPGALTSSVGFRIDPETASPPDTLGLFTISPAGVTLLKPVTLTVTLPPDVQAGPDTGLAVDSPNGAVPLGATIGAAARQFSVQLSFLPPATAVAARAFAASAQRAQPAATDVATRVRMRLERQIDGARRNNTFLFLVDTLKLQGSIDNAIVVQLAADSLALGATSDNAVMAGMLDWRNVVCPQQNFAVSALNTFNGVDVVSFGRLARDAMVWTLLARDMDATLRRVFNTTVPLCSGLPDDFRQPVIDKLPAFIEAVTASLNRLDARTEFDQLLKARLPELVDLESLMQEFDLGPAVLNLIGAQAVRLRVAAYQACRSDGDQLPQKDLLESTPLFSVTTPFAEADVREDIQFCGMPLRWQLKNETGQIVGEGTAGGIAAGQTLTAVDLPLTGVSQLVLMGPLSALRCVSREPDNGGVDRVVRRQNNEQLSFSAGPLAGALTSVGLLTSSNEETYLAVSTLALDVAQLQALALPAGPPGSGRLVVTRQGGVCNGAFANLSAHDAIVTFGLNFDSVRITTTSLPDGTAGSTYSATLAAVGGQQPYTWAASGLPAGLSLNASTGVISGTPTTAGSFTISPQVRSADGQTARSTVTVTVINTASGILGGGHNAIVEIALPSGPVNCPAPRIDEFGTKATGSVSVSCAGQSGESAAASLSFTKIFAPDPRGIGSDLVGLTATGISSVGKGGEFDQPAATSQYILRFTATRTTQLAIDASFTFPAANANGDFTLGRDGIVVFESGGGPVKQTLTLLPGTYQLIVFAQVFRPVDSSASAGFNVQLAFGP